MTTDTETKPATLNWNRPAYIAFILAGIVFLIMNDLSQGVIFWGLALVFDPFDQKTPFGKRPIYQRVWLIAHLAITMGLFMLMITQK